MSIRVLQVLGRSAGGIARHVAQVVDALDGTDDLIVDVACPPGLPIPMPKPPRHVHIPDGLSGHLAAIRALRSILSERDYDVVHAHGLRAGVDSALAARTRLPARARPRLITTVHNLVQRDIVGRRAALDRWAEPLVVRLSDHTLAVSEEIARRLRAAAGAGSTRVEVLYLGIGQAPEVRASPAEVRASVGVSAGAHLAVAVARLAPQKALPVLFDAIARTGGDVTLVVLGEGPLGSELRALVSARGLDERIRFLGFRDDVADVVAAADVFCLSSTWEGVPLAAQEAILLGTPIVSTDVGGMSELISDGLSGRLVPAGDVVALAAALDELCSSPELRRRYAARASSDLAKRFSTEAMLDRLKTLYGTRSDG